MDLGLLSADSRRLAQVCCSPHRASEIEPCFLVQTAESAKPLVTLSISRRAAHNSPAVLLGSYISIRSVIG
jgi:hypothetical protein